MSIKKELPFIEAFCSHGGHSKDCYECRIAELEHDISNLSICELAGRNSSVASYVEHWEGRALKAEGALQAAAIRIVELEAAVKALTDTGCDKIMAMSEDQINALCRLEGHDPKDEAKLAEQAMEIAILKAKLARYENQPVVAYAISCKGEPNVPARFVGDLGGPWKCWFHTPVITELITKPSEPQGEIP